MASNVEYVAHKRLGPKTREYKANAWRRLYEGAVVEVLPEIATVGGEARVRVTERERERYGGGVELILTVEVWFDTGA